MAINFPLPEGFFSGQAKLTEMVPDNLRSALNTLHTLLSGGAGVSIFTLAPTGTEDASAGVYTDFASAHAAMLAKPGGKTLIVPEAIPVSAFVAGSYDMDSIRFMGDGSARHVVDIPAGVRMPNLNHIENLDLRLRFDFDGDLCDVSGFPHIVVKNSILRADPTNNAIWRVDTGSYAVFSIEQSSRVSFGNSPIVELTGTGGATIFLKDYSEANDGAFAGEAGTTLQVFSDPTSRFTKNLSVIQGTLDSIEEADAVDSAGKAITIAPRSRLLFWTADAAGRSVNNLGTSAGGFAGAQAVGIRVTIYNAGADAFDLVHLSGAEQNRRFRCPGGVDFTLNPGNSVDVVYFSYSPTDQNGAWHVLG